jgi:hypothetical protein
MKRKQLLAIALALFLPQLLTSCIPSDTPLFRSSRKDCSDGRVWAFGSTKVNTKWPLTFQSHEFEAYCFSTYACRVKYGCYDQGEVYEYALTPPSTSFKNYPDMLKASGRFFPNFPAPAKITWRSEDDTPHEAEIDMGEIFKDGLVRHNVSRQDVSKNGLWNWPEIILEVNDRTINVYMRAHISTKELQKPGNKYSDFRADLVKVFSRTY